MINSSIFAISRNLWPVAESRPLRKSGCDLVRTKTVIPSVTAIAPRAQPTMLTAISISHRIVHRSLHQSRSSLTVCVRCELPCRDIGEDNSAAVLDQAGPLDNICSQRFVVCSGSSSPVPERVHARDHAVALFPEPAKVAVRDGLASSRGSQRIESFQIHGLAQVL